MQENKAWRCIYSNYATNTPSIIFQGTSIFQKNIYTVLRIPILLAANIFDMNKYHFIKSLFSYFGVRQNWMQIYHRNVVTNIEILFH